MLTEVFILIPSEFYCFTYVTRIILSYASLASVIFISISRELLPLSVSSIVPLNLLQSRKLASDYSISIVRS